MTDHIADASKMVAARLRWLAYQMRTVAAQMLALQAGEHIDAHAAEMQGAARIADGWADGIEVEDGGNG
jgi:hypothetical protein